MNDAVLDSEILLYEFGGIGVVRQNSANLRRRQKNVLGTLGGEEGLDCIWFVRSSSAWVRVMILL